MCKLNMWALISHVSVEREQKHLGGSSPCAVVAELAVHLFPWVLSEFMLTFQAPGSVITQAHSDISVDGSRV